MSRVRAVLFDMDGVLVDAGDWHFEALNEALAAHGHMIQREEHMARFDGLSTQQKLQTLTVERGIAPDLHPIICKAKQEITWRMIRERARPDPTHVRAFTELRRRGYHLAVCSNAVRASVDLVLERTALAPLVDLTLSNEDVKRRKPDPEVYLAAAARFGLHPEACLVVEDNPNGVAAALGAGARLLRVRSPQDVTLEAVEDAIARAEALTSRGARQDQEG